MRVALVAVLAATMVACGSEKGPSRAETYATQMTTLCGKYTKQRKARADANEFTEASFQAGRDDMHSFIRTLDELTPPPRVAPRHEKLVASYRALEVAFDYDPFDAEADEAALNQIVTAAAERARTAADQLGYPTCGPITRLTNLVVATCTDDSRVVPARHECSSSS